MPETVPFWMFVLVAAVCGYLVVALADSRSAVRHLQANIRVLADTASSLCGVVSLLNQTVSNIHATVDDVVDIVEELKEDMPGVAAYDDDDDDDD